MVTAQWDRQTIEGMKGWEMPTVRCRYSRRNVTEDGIYSEPILHDTPGRIVIDGNNPWVEICAAGGWHAERFSWGLVLAVLNDPREAPIWFNKEFVYEV